MNLTTSTPQNAAPSSRFILAELRGGPHHGQLIRVPVDEFLLILSDHGKQYRYHRTGGALVFHCESALVQMFEGKGGVR